MAEQYTFGEKALSKEDEMLLAEGLFNNAFDDAFIGKAKRVCMEQYRVSLDTTYILELALKDAMGTPAQILEEYQINRGAAQGTRNKKYDDKWGKLYQYIRKDAEKNPEVYGDMLYLAALDAIESYGFNISKQMAVNNLFNKLKGGRILEKNFEETANSKANPESLSDILNPAVFAYNAVVKSGFDKKISENALRWYQFCTEKNFALGFYGGRIGQDDMAKAANIALENIRNSCMARKYIYSEIRESLDYIKYINKIKSARDFLKKTGFDYAAKLLKAEVDTDAAINIMKQQVGKYDDEDIDAVLGAIEFMKSEGCTMQKSDILWILEAYMKPEHPLQKARKSMKTGRPTETDKRMPAERISERVMSLYRELGGNGNAGLTAAQQYELDKKRRERAPETTTTSTGFNLDDYERKQEALRKKREMEWNAQKEMEMYGFKGKKVVFKVNSITNKSKGVVNGSATNLKLPHKIIAKKVMGANVGDMFTATIGKKNGDHYEVTGIMPYTGKMPAEE